MSRKTRKSKLIYIYDSKGCLINKAESIEELKEKYSLQESIRFAIARGGIVEIEEDKTYCSRKVYNSEELLTELDMGNNVKSVVRRSGQKYKRKDSISHNKMLIVSNLTGEKLAVYATIKSALELSKISSSIIYRALKVGKIKTRTGFVLETKE